MLRYLVLFFFAGAFIYAVYEIDKILKLNALKHDISDSLVSGALSYDNQTMIKDLVDNKSHILIYPDNTFSVSINNTTLLAPLMGVLFIILIWCFYLHFFMAYMKRKRIVWVEV